ncbi:nuclear pore complex protein Nup160 [Lepeophtheirus salmonis]|uniref:nuclear pore complex protein Nup160 n=1 Tax=Lepeophtheirus salmonis TaxID=72036 RepID=UPI001AE420BD|nr:nuclear pore complex protein Nup160-like [Lepeophtheirus salmonis]
MENSPVLMGMREVTPNQTIPEECREFFIDTGGSQSTLQDVKLPDTAGGFAYANAANNRFIIWRTVHDELELTEYSLDTLLHSNKVKFKFQDTPLLEGLSIHETYDSLIILVSTVSSVHKMVFSHPDQLVDPETSIFVSASARTAKDHFHLLTQMGTGPLPSSSASFHTLQDESIFVLANPSGQMTLVRLGNMPGIVSVNSIKSTSYLGRLLGTLSFKSTEASVVSLIIHPLLTDYYIFGLCNDHKLRMWSASTYECITVTDILQYTVEQSLEQGTQNHILKKVHSGGKHLTLAVFLCFSEHSQFCIFKPTRNAGQFSFDHVATIYAPEYDLVDFTVSKSHITALWTSPGGENVLRYASIKSHFDSESSHGGWNNVVLEDTLNPDFNVGSEEFDPRQAYLKQLFHPGRFSIQTLTKTIGIYRRCLNNTLMNEYISIARLREEVCAAVEAEIQNQVTDYEISDEEYIALSHSAWARFYSCATQYHQAGLKPMGLVCDSHSGMVCIVKKSCISFVRSVDALEHLVLKNGIISVDAEDLFYDTQVLCEDVALAQDVISLMRAISLVSSVVTDMMSDEFFNSLHLLVSPEKVAEACATAILVGDEDHPNLNFTQELSARLQQVKDIGKALEILIRISELDNGIVSHSDGIFEKTSVVFSSPMGISIVAESLHQTTRIRFHLARDLIILLQLILTCGSTMGISPKAFVMIHSTFLPRSVVMVHCYFILLWLNETTVTPPPPNSLEQGLRQMNVLSTESSSFDPCGPQLARMSLTCSLTLAELFLNGPGRKARSLLTSDTVSSKPWHSVLLPLVNISAQLLWPKCAVATLPEFLLSACQYMQIQEYTRLLSTWCDWNSHSRLYLLGAALLYMGEPEKACDWMIQAAGGITSDPFLYSQLFKNDNDVDQERLIVLYFLKVIQQFEQCGYSDFVIKLAETAMAICDQNDPDRATLCYILFSYHLKLGHNDEAYDAMVANPDKSRRKDSLRQFVVTLFDRKQLRQLACYPFIDMLEELEMIIESRARSVDLTVNNYYDFLYSFHVMKDNYRKAAYVMYECGMRLGTEVFTKNGLKKQIQCYLSSINCLKLVNQDYAWIIKPVLASPYQSASPKHDVDGQEIILSDHLKPKLEVLEMKDIKKEFELSCARLKLLNKDISYARPGLSPGETVSVLIASNLFEDAIQISSLFNLDFRPIVEGLASRCVRLSQIKNESAWDWIAENNPSGADVRSGSCVDAAWKLLQNIVERLESRGMTSIHKAIVMRLFSLGALIPTWIVNEYKKRNTAELLRLYLIHGYLEDAAYLAIEYVNAVLGKGKEYFGIESMLEANSAPVWLPYTALDHLLLELREHSSDEVYKKLYEEVHGRIQIYLSTAQRISQDKKRIQSRQ